MCSIPRANENKNPRGGRDTAAADKKPPITQLLQDKLGVGLALKH